MEVEIERTDPVITPFVQNHLKNGWEIKRTRLGYDHLETCPECKSGYLYTFKKGLFSKQDCPNCDYCKNL